MKRESSSAIVIGDSESEGEEGAEQAQAILSVPRKRLKRGSRRPSEAEEERVELSSLPLSPSGPSPKAEQQQRALLHAPPLIAKQVLALLVADPAVRLLRTAHACTCPPPPAWPGTPPPLSRFWLAFGFGSQQQTLLVLYDHTGRADAVWEQGGEQGGGVVGVALPDAGLRAALIAFDPADTTALCTLVREVRAEQRRANEARVRALKDLCVGEADFEACAELGNVEWSLQEGGGTVEAVYRVPLEADLRGAGGEEEVVLVVSFPARPTEEDRRKRLKVRRVVAGPFLTPLLASFKPPLGAAAGGRGGAGEGGREGGRDIGSLRGQHPLADLLRASAEQLRAFLAVAVTGAVARQQVVQACMKRVGVPLEQDQQQWTRSAHLVMGGRERLPVMVTVTLPEDFPRTAPGITLTVLHALAEQAPAIKKLTLRYRRSDADSPSGLADNIRAAVIEALPSWIDSLGRR
jgi:hypothetical protein